MGTPARIMAAIVATTGLAVGVWLLRDSTMSTHTQVPDGSQLAVVIDAETNHAEGGQTLREMATAKVLTCRLEIRHSDPVSGLRPVDGESGRFRFVLAPTLDETDRTQFRGCLEDWNLDHVLVDVVDMHEPSGE